MQASDMRALRTLYSHRHLVTHPTAKAKSFRCLNHFRFASSFSASVDAVYDPISGSIRTKKRAAWNGRQDQELESSSGASVSENDVEEYEGGRVKWNVKGRESADGQANSSPRVRDCPEGRVSAAVEKQNAPFRLTVGGSVKSSSGSENDVEENEGGRLKWNVKGRASADGRANPSPRVLDFPEDRVSAAVEKQNAPFRLTASSKKTKKGKIRTQWVCSDCGHTEGQWWGTCRKCMQVGTMKEFLDEGPNDANAKVTGFQLSEKLVKSWLPQRVGDDQPLRMADVNRGLNHSDWRIPLYGRFGHEVSRVLGGGLVPGSLVLVGGDPGVGKSTLLLQLGAMISEGRDLGKAAPVVYVSGEESVEQICSRADRISIVTDELYLYPNTEIEDILEKCQVLSPRAIIVDSIQTVYLQGVTGSAGGLMQVKECTSALLRFAKKTNVPVILIGHVTKSGDIAGPRVLEHIVDVVLYLEGEKCSSHRLLRSVKNRYGSTDELGVFEMSQLGLQPIENPSEMFLSQEQSGSEVLAGLAVAVIMDGSRTFLVEVQALCLSGPSVSRHVNGIPAGRADMIISVLVKQAGLKIQQNAVFLNVVSGVTLSETAADLAVAAAICSSFLEYPIPSGIAFIGEVGLGGELRSVPRMEKRVNTLAKLGYKTCIIPKSAMKVLEPSQLGNMVIIGCLNLKEVINTVFVT
ncbi:hypothetical protein SAY87_005663 [Trapa incisa]|uniref:RecA family profile 1 domain-containing protein n=1 Tax=Trapa incisa TaxID=236973 RepID=A0AAN7K553_9MYRT|nr:hypothetical protein SAY87_005663 [Trapa incisa]